MSMEAQAVPAVLMVRPRRFGANPETRASNVFQRSWPGDAAQLAARARREFEGLAGRLDAAGVEVVVVDDLPGGASPDALFPNNWVSFHADGTVVLYPMATPARRAERRADVLDALDARGFVRSRVIDLAPLEADGRFCEGTGSLVLDRPARVAYAALSGRTHPDAVAAFGARLGYATASFATADAQGRPVYHTNVLMSLGRRFAVVCPGVIAPADRAALLDRLAASGREIIAIDPAQMARFCANLLELDGARGPVIALSTAALAGFDPAQRAVLERHATLVAAPLDCIEAVGGGGARCMLAELALPRRARTP